MQWRKTFFLMSIQYTMCRYKFTQFLFDLIMEQEHSNCQMLLSTLQVQNIFPAEKLSMIPAIYIFLFSKGCIRSSVKRSSTFIRDPLDRPVYKLYCYLCTFNSSQRGFVAVSCLGSIMCLCLPWNVFRSWYVLDTFSSIKVHMNVHVDPIWSLWNSVAVYDLSSRYSSCMTLFAA